MRKRSAVLNISQIWAQEREGHVKGWRDFIKFMEEMGLEPLYGKEDIEEILERIKKEGSLHSVKVYVNRKEWWFQVLHMLTRMPKSHYYMWPEDIEEIKEQLKEEQIVL